MPWSDRRRDPALVYLSAFVALGLCATLLGPAIPMLRANTGASKSEISILFVVGTPGYILGSWVAGRLYDRGGGHSVLAKALGVVALGAFMLLFLSDSLAGLAMAFSVIGVGMSAIDVGCNTLLVWSRTGDVGAIMNALHLCFGIGALVGPLSVGLSEWWLDDIGSAAAVVVVAALAVAVMAMRIPAPTPRSPGADTVEEVDRQQGQSDRLTMLLIGVFFSVYVGMELGFAGWISTYAEDQGLGDAPIPAFVVATFWAGFTLCRVAAVRVARQVSAVRILMVTCVLALVASGVLWLADGATAAVWICTFLFGAAVAPQYPTMVALAEERVGLTGSATAMIVAFSSLGGLALPWIIGQVIGPHGSGIMPLVITIAAAVLLLWFVLIERVTRRSDAERPVVAVG